MDSDNVFFKLVEWVWIPIVATIVHLYARVFGMGSDMNKALGILQTTTRHHDLQRTEDNDRTQREISEVKEKIDRHHDAVMKEIAKVRDDIKKS